MCICVCTTAPESAFKPLIEQKEAPINENYAEIRFSKEKGKKVDVGTFVCFFSDHFAVKKIHKHIYERYN